jgi:hypothetical protein
MNIDKIKELKSCIGESVSENFSPTLRAKLLTIDESRGGGVCIMEVVPSSYTSMVNGGDLLNNDKVGERYEAPINRIWNAYFF